METVDAEGKIVDATAFFANFTAGKYATVTSKETSSNKFVNAGGAIGDGAVSYTHLRRPGIMKRRSLQRVGSAQKPQR